MVVLDEKLEVLLFGGERMNPTTIIGHVFGH